MNPWYLIRNEVNYLDEMKLLGGLLCKLVLHASLNVVPVYCHIIIPVQTRLFMPQTKCVKQLMEDHTMLDTAGTKGEELDTSLESHIAVATITREDIHEILL